jgi:hypothetical protein
MAGGSDGEDSLVGLSGLAREGAQGPWSCHRSWLAGRGGGHAGCAMARARPQRAGHVLQTLSRSVRRETARHQKLVMSMDRQQALRAAAKFPGCQVA